MSSKNEKATSLFTRTVGIDDHNCLINLAGLRFKKYEK